MVGTSAKEDMLTRVAAARRDHRRDVLHEPLPAQEPAPTPRQKARQSLLRVWLVRCPNNKHLSTLVTSPIQPKYCPVCGFQTPFVTERV